jgi:hypothetical protein
VYYVLTAGISIFVTALVTSFFTVYYTSPANKRKWTLGIVHGDKGWQPILERHIPSNIVEWEYIYINQENAALIANLAYSDVPQVNIFGDERLRRLFQEAVNRGQGQISGLRKTNEEEGGR